MLWEELVKLALLGTDRSNLSANGKKALLALGVDTEQESTKVILEGAALQASLQKVGLEPKEWTNPILAPNLSEQFDQCSAKSAKHLALILSGQYAFVLKEYIAAILKYNKCLPYEFLPAILDKCTKNPILWEQIKSIIGQRGHWLLQLNPDWHALNIHSSVEYWETGTKKERIAILKMLRKQTPQQALSLLQSTWQEDGLTEKTAFLKCLEIGLSNKDEVFLESCLDFSRKEIRLIAAKLLYKLPDSQLQQRIAKRLKVIVSIESEKVHISISSTDDKSLLRDGILPNKKGTKISTVANTIFRQLIAAHPPSFWEQYFQKKPSEILNLFSQSDYGLVVIEALSEASALHQSSNWMEAILKFWLANYSSRKFAQLDISTMLDALPTTIFNKVLLGKLKAVKFLPDEHSPLIQLLQKEGFSWENPLSQIVMEQLKAWLTDNPSYSWTGYQYRNMLKQAAYAVHPNMERTLFDFWMKEAHTWAGWEKNLQHFLNTLKFRREMIEEIAKSHEV